MTLHLSDPELTWTRAIEFWRAGDPSRVAALLRNGAPITDTARAWLAGVIDGTITRPRGRPPEPPHVAHYIREVAVIQLFYALRDQYADEVNPGREGTPSERALSETAVRLSISESAVSRVVHPRKVTKGGI